MVRVGDSSIFQSHTAGKPPDSNCFQPKRQGFATSCVNPKTAVSPALATTFPGYAFTGNLYLNPKEANAVYGLRPHSFPRYHQALFPAPITSLKPKALEASHKHGGNGSFQKKFLIFDRSKNGTRPIFGPQVRNEPDTYGRKQCSDFHANNRDQLGINLTQDLNRPVLEEESDEHHIVEEEEEESDMHEDTEEINALLYSDGDDDNSGGYESDEDEVKSTGHTPSITLELCGKCEQFDETEDKSGPNKRRKLLSGASTGHLSTPMIKTALSKLNGSNEYGDGVNIANLSIGLELSKRDKIRQTLKILENIVPDAKGKDPVVILDGAIDYLKAMKLRAQVIGKNLH